MLLDHFRMLYRYNSWAWDQVFASLEQLEQEAYMAERPFFWGSLHGLTVHALTAEWLWLRRLEGESPAYLLDPADYADFAAVRAAWRPVRTGWEQFLHNLSTEDLTRHVAYRNTSGVPQETLLMDIVQQVLNHATEHRSQMTPVLYALGVPTRPLDYIYYRLERV